MLPEYPVVSDLWLRWKIFNHHNKVKVTIAMCGKDCHSLLQHYGPFLLIRQFAYFVHFPASLQLGVVMWLILALCYICRRKWREEKQILWLLLLLAVSLGLRRMPVVIFRDLLDVMLLFFSFPFTVLSPPFLFLPTFPPLPSFTLSQHSSPFLQNQSLIFYV